MRRLALLLVLALTASACAPVLGQRGELGFAYGADDALSYVSVRRPLAVGCQAEIVVYASDAKQTNPDIIWGDEVMREAKPADVTAARSENPDVFKVVDTDGSNVVLEGIAAGKGRLHIETADGQDVIEVEVAETARVEVGHLAWDSELATPDNTVLLYGGTVHFDIERLDEKGRALACLDPGRGVDIEPTDAVRVVNRPRDMHHLRLELDTPARLEITPDGGEARTLSTTPPEAIDRMSIDVVRSADATGPVSMDAGQSMIFRVSALTATGGFALALDGLLDVTSETPEVCEVASLSQIASDGLYAVRGIAPGKCKLSAGIAGASTTEAFEVLAPAR